MNVGGWRLTDSGMSLRVGPRLVETTPSLAFTTIRNVAKNWVHTTWTTQYVSTHHTTWMVQNYKLYQATRNFAKISRAHGNHTGTNVAKRSRYISHCGRMEAGVFSQISAMFNAPFRTSFPMTTDQNDGTLSAEHAV